MTILKYFEFTRDVCILSTEVFFLPILNSVLKTFISVTVEVVLFQLNMHNNSGT